MASSGKDSTLRSSFCFFFAEVFFCFCCREFSKRYILTRAHFCVSLSDATTIINIFCDVGDEAVYNKQKKNETVLFSRK